MQGNTTTRVTGSTYELLDFGDGRKLERFADAIVLRPCPTAEGLSKAHLELWANVTARFRGARTGEGSWAPRPREWMPDDWRFRHEGEASLHLKLDAHPSGQVGVFPEQCPNWDWIARQTRRAEQRLGRAPRVLNLFAYTGGSTLAAAGAGAEVVHIDAARNIVERARENAALSGLGDRPIRWIAEDAVKFCRREVKRGNQYEGVILDPPSYGHGPKGEAWKIAEHLLPLLELCAQLTSDNRAFLLATCHTPGIGAAELGAYFADGIFGHCGQAPETGELYLQTAAGRRLASGVYARSPR